MRFVLIGLGIVAAVLTAGIRSGNAQGYSNQWCTDGAGRGNGGVLQCAYATLAQCRAAASGRGMGCTRNPDYGRGSRGSNGGGSQGY
jgi:hypothetical protein